MLHTLRCAVKSVDEHPDLAVTDDEVRFSSFVASLEVFYAIIAAHSVGCIPGAPYPMILGEEPFQTVFLDTTREPFPFHGLV